MKLDPRKMAVVGAMVCLCVVSIADAARPREGRRQRRACRRCPARTVVERPDAKSAKSGHSARPTPNEGRWFDGRSLAGWKVTKEALFKEHGRVQVRNGCIELAAGSPATGIVRVGATPRMNYEVSLEAMRTSGSDFFCGLTFPIRKASCTLIIGGWGGTLVGLSNVDSEPANENDTSSYKEMVNDRWYRIRLRVTEKRIDAWIDDEQMIQLDTTDREFDIWWEQEPMRPLGIATWYTGAALRNIRMTRVEGEH